MQNWHQGTPASFLLLQNTIFFALQPHLCSPPLSVSWLQRVHPCSIQRSCMVCFAFSGYFWYSSPGKMQQMQKRVTFPLWNSLGRRHLVLRGLGAHWTHMLTRRRGALWVPLVYHWSTTTTSVPPLPLLWRTSTENSNAKVHLCNKQRTNTHTMKPLWSAIVPQFWNPLNICLLCVGPAGYHRV